jgi:hypothetical protein
MCCLLLLLHATAAVNLDKHPAPAATVLQHRCICAPPLRHRTPPHATQAARMCRHAAASAGQLQVILLHGREPEGDSAGGRRLSSAGGVQPHPHTHVLDYFLRLRTGELKKLMFPKQPKQASVLDCSCWQQGALWLTSSCLHKLAAGGSKLQQRCCACAHRFSVAAAAAADASYWGLYHGAVGTRQQLQPDCCC